MVAYNLLSDDDLLALLKDRDHRAYAEIYQRYWSILYRYSRKILQNEEESRDVIQDVFVMVWSKSDTLDLHTSLSSFLYAAVRNSILKLFERGKVREKYMNSLEQFIDEGTNITDHLVRNRELASRIESEIAKLPAKMREVFELSRKVNLSHKEIATRMDISDKTVKKQMNNAIKILRLKLGSLASFIF
ncbi:RNA polymerase sigma-70 factor [Pedobacter cryoconitis]|uniref:RNA polymerase sigma-70 factor (ECF subfamily) n=1 Tax=Pedobacter cryoconitis TaxID=188932 RepID=A0A7X0J4J0_9SPHI|nr:RNA polymerase sigma-70 factor [Pedobacter cryoconitis]MBB6500730.1 RNA polymerase sigma-70 factor (ECF subfamily) [Pedobacter cryoconitis]